MGVWSPPGIRHASPPASSTKGAVRSSPMAPQRCGRCPKLLLHDVPTARIADYLLRDRAQGHVGPQEHTSAIALRPPATARSAGLIEIHCEIHPKLPARKFGVFLVVVGNKRKKEWRRRRRPEAGKEWEGGKEGQNGISKLHRLYAGAFRLPSALSEGPAGKKCHKPWAWLRSRTREIKWRADSVSPLCCLNRY